MSVMVLQSGYVVDGLGLIPRIKGLYRDQTHRRERWLVRLNTAKGMVRAGFYDSAFGGAAWSYKAAVKFLYSHGELHRQGTRKTLKERRDKKNKTGVPGVCVRVQHVGKLDYYCIVVTPLAEQPGKWIYAGNENTAKLYMRAALVLAKDLREQSVFNYRRNRRIPLKDAMPWQIPGIM